MKSLLLTTMLLTSWWIHAGGGVDVGNGTKMVPFYTEDYPSELDLKDALRGIRTDIVTQRDVRVLNTNIQAKCEGNPKISGVEQIKKYNFENNRLMPKKLYKGKVGVLFKNCEASDLLPSQIGNHY